MDSTKIEEEIEQIRERADKEIKNLLKKEGFSTKDGIFYIRDQDRILLFY